MAYSKSKGACRQGVNAECQRILNVHHQIKSSSLAGGAHPSRLTSGHTKNTHDYQMRLGRYTCCSVGVADSAAANVLSTCSAHSSSALAAVACASPPVVLVSVLYASASDTSAARTAEPVDQSGRGTWLRTLLKYAPSRLWYLCSCCRAPRTAACTASLWMCTAS